MSSKKEAVTNAAILALRAAVGIQLAVFHGWEKLSAFSVKAGSFPDHFGIGHRNSLIAAVIVEVGAAGLLAVGLFGRISAFLVAASLGLTVFATQKGTPWHARELMILYFASALTLLAVGPGKFSLDGFRSGRKGGSKPAPPKAAS